MIFPFYGENIRDKESEKLPQEGELGVTSYFNFL